MITAVKINFGNIKKLKLRVVKKVPAVKVKELSNEEQRSRFLHALFAKCLDGYIEFRPLHCSNHYRQWVPASNIQATELPEDKNVYVGVATRHNKKGTKGDIIEIPAVWVDVDFKQTPEEEVLKHINAFTLRPSIHVMSGGGVHLYWVLETPATSKDIAKIEDINRRLADYFGGDKGSAEAAHILRLPGTMNMKYDPPRPVILSYSRQDMLYNVNDFNFLPMCVERSIVPKSIFGWHDDILQGVPEGQRHDKALQLVGRYLGKKLSTDEISTIVHNWNQLNHPPLPDDEINSVVKGIYNKHMKERNKGKNYVIEDDPVPIPDLDEIIERSVIDVNDFLKMKLPEREYIISPWLKAGNLALISAERGIGKTWLVLVIAVAVTRGIRIGKWLVTKPTGCLIIDGEMAIDEIQTRMRGLEKSLIKKRQKPLKFMSSDHMKGNDDPAPNLTDSYWRDYIERYLHKHDDIRLLIIDNISSLMPGLDENAKQPWDNINQWLLKLRSHGISVIMIHHTGKRGDYQRGTSAREDNIDISIMLTRPKGCEPKDGTMFNIEFSKARTVYGDDAEKFCLHIKTDKKGKTTWDEKKQMHTKDISIINLLASGNKQKAIATMVGCTPSYVSQVKSKAIKNGIVDKQGALTEKGLDQCGVFF
jgi:putative DNA primase/helicase